MSSRAGNGPIGVYGVRIVGLDSVGGSSPGEPEWPLWNVQQVVGSVEYEEGVDIQPDEALIGLGRGEGIRLDRKARTVTYTFHRLVPAEAMLHPGLVPAMAVAAMWDGRAALHCSALLVRDKVWALLADREGGKSTTAALLVERECPLFTDDMLIAAGHTVFAGPGSIDLRPEAARALGGENLGQIGERERWRKRVPIVRNEAPLGGLIVLDWDDRVKVEELDVAERFAQLDRHLSLPVLGEQFLALADRPMLRFTRPRDLAQAGSAADALKGELLARA